MAAKKFSKTEWDKIFSLAKQSAQNFGFPNKRAKSVVIGTFNIRKLGRLKNRSKQAWDFLEMICKPFDLLAVQEVMDELEGLHALRERMGPDYGLVVSDVTGTFPGAQGNTERLAFLFNWKRIERTSLASDISYDRSKIVETLFENRSDFKKAWDKYAADLSAWEEKAKKAKAAGKRRPTRPSAVLPMFLTFIRQPHCASFRIPGKNGTKPFEFLTVNAHLLYGTNKNERKWEFDALIEWLTLRAKMKEKLYHENILMMGDCNLEFEKADVERDDIDKFLKGLNKSQLASRSAATANFPLLTPHPTHGLLRTSARQEQTYDQIALFSHDKRLPKPPANDKAGKQGPDGYDYGVVNFVNLFSKALKGGPYDNLSKKDQKWIIARTEFDVSDHMPAWFRLPIPGA